MVHGGASSPAASGPGTAPTGHYSPSFRAPLAALQEKNHTSGGPQGETAALRILEASPEESREAGGGRGGGGREPQALGALAWPGCPQAQGTRSQPPKTHMWLHLREHHPSPPQPITGEGDAAPTSFLSSRPGRPDPQPPHPTRTSSSYTSPTALSPAPPVPAVTHTPQGGHPRCSSHLCPYPPLCQLLSPHAAPTSCPLSCLGAPGPEASSSPLPICTQREP